jgi:hypothetical protein
MPLFFSPNALSPTRLVPGWLQAVSKANPLPHEVNALRCLLIRSAHQPLARHRRADRLHNCRDHGGADALP